MAISQAQIEKIVSLAKDYGATRLILFGSAAEKPAEAKDIDIACDGIAGWKLYELAARRKDVAGREPTVREKTAAAGFMAQFYGGIENILKRISHFYGIPLPTGDTWHIDLFVTIQPALRICS